MNADEVARPQTQTKDGNRYQVDAQVCSDQTEAGERLRQQKFHRAAVDLAGDGPGRSPDSPDAQDRLDERVHVTNGQQIHRPVHRDGLAADDGTDDLTGSVEDDV